MKYLEWHIPSPYITQKYSALTNVGCFTSEVTQLNPKNKANGLRRNLETRFVSIVGQPQFLAELLSSEVKHPTLVSAEYFCVM